MNSNRKHPVLGILIDAVDYGIATEEILCAAREGRPYAVSALAVHGTMTGVLNPELRYRLNNCDLIVPDGQPVRWALNWLYKTGLQDRVYGPRLTLRVLSKMAEEGLSVYLYGSTAKVVHNLEDALAQRFPRLHIAGAEPSRFRPLTCEERDQLIRRVQASGARLLLAGLGCPRQEIFAYEMRDLLRIPVLAIGAAFPFIAGTLPQAPPWMQDHGLEWLYRLFQEPRRLWKRYVFLNPAYLVCVLLQRFRIPFDSKGVQPSREILVG
ncbi:MAG TPA: WecB/TagA/CpsF family glycosyltransferase [Bryobacteraceae bacterium]|jgi:exopolysaccharide biosynthesis WecB/TagA/CpsF family protein|nr:WecB/TagA/CpsF family glycosyltransferase [Bryobacteraceae bacterium]